MSLGLADNLPALIRAKFNAACSSEALRLASSHLAVLNVGGTPFQLRFCPELAKKPKGEDDNIKSGKKIDPFDNPPDDLLVAQVPANDSSHVVVLNKYPIIAEHFILATKQNKQQTHKLEVDDLQIAYQCLKEWSGQTEDGQRKRLFAFFNSGEHSGASQPHRHLQFLPVEDMQGGEAGRGWTLLADSVWASEDADTEASAFKSNSRLPFMHFGQRLPARPSGVDLMHIYSALLEKATDSVKQFISRNPDGLSLHDTTDGSQPISYNLALTSEVMILCPRRRGGGVTRRPGSAELHNVELNGTLLAGTLMVKNEESYNLLKEDASQLGNILRSIGIPSVDMAEQARV